MDARTLLTLIYDEDQLNELAENIRRYPNEPIINLLERVFPAAAQPAPTAAAPTDGAPTVDWVGQAFEREREIKRWLHDVEPDNPAAIFAALSIFVNGDGYSVCEKDGEHLPTTFPRKMALCLHKQGLAEFAENDDWMRITDAGRQWYAAGIPQPDDAPTAAEHGERYVSLSEAAKISRATYHRLLAEEEAAREAEAARNADQRDFEIARLKADNARLLTALKPFANYVHWFNQKPMQHDFNVIRAEPTGSVDKDAPLTVAHFRAAAAIVQWVEAHNSADNRGD